MVISHIFSLFKRHACISAPLGHNNKNFITSIQNKITFYKHIPFYWWSILGCSFRHTLPPARNLLQTCFSVFPHADLHSLSAWFLHVLELNSLQTSDRIFFLSPPTGFLSCFSWLFALMPRLVRQLLQTWANSSVVRKACPFSQFIPFLPNT